MRSKVFEQPTRQLRDVNPTKRVQKERTLTIEEGACLTTLKEFDARGDGKKDRKKAHVDSSYISPFRAFASNHGIVKAHVEALIEVEIAIDLTTLYHRGIGNAVGIRATISGRAQYASAESEYANTQYASETTRWVNSFSSIGSSLLAQVNWFITIGAGKLVLGRSRLSGDLDNPLGAGAFMVWLGHSAGGG